MQFGFSRITGRLFNNMKLYLLLNDKKALWEGTEDGLQSISYEAPPRIPNRHFLHHLYATPNTRVTSGHSNRSIFRDLTLSTLFGHSLPYNNIALKQSSGRLGVYRQKHSVADQWQIANVLVSFLTARPINLFSSQHADSFFVINPDRAVQEFMGYGSR